MQGCRATQRMQLKYISSGAAAQNAMRRPPARSVAHESTQQHYVTAKDPNFQRLEPCTSCLTAQLPDIHTIHTTYYMYTTQIAHHTACCACSDTPVYTHTHNAGPQSQQGLLLHRFLAGFVFSSFVSGFPSRKSVTFCTVVPAMFARASCVRKAEWGVTSTCHMADRKE